MKKVILALLLAMSFNASAMNSSGIRTEVRCINGYQYLFAWSSSSNDSPNVIQIFGTAGPTNVPQPLACRGK